MIIIYRVTTLPFFSMTWVTESTHIRENEFFVDEQRVGPYKMHHLAEISSGVMMKDIFSYQPPFGFIGSMANTLFIKNKLCDILDFLTDNIIYS
ncbi:hypothetical protein ACFL35_14020 [Candidatus Riflebacteria bacterium]